MKNKIGICVAITGLIFQSPASSTPNCADSTDCEMRAVNLYVGPETVTPGQDIFVMAELETVSGNSVLDGTFVTLTYTQDNKTFVHSGNAINGIAKFTISSGKRAGQIDFKAASENYTSTTAKTLVSSGEIRSFEAKSTLGLLPNSLQIETDIVADKYGNRVEDGTLASLVSRVDDRVSNIQSTYIANGRANFDWRCPVGVVGKHSLEVQIKQASTFYDVSSSFCDTVRNK